MTTTVGKVGQLDYEQGVWLRTIGAEGWNRLFLCYETICNNNACEMDFIHSQRSKVDMRGVGSICPECGKYLVEETRHWHLSTAG